MHVDAVVEVPRARVQRAREEACVLVVRLDERGHLAARDIRAVVRLRGKQQDDSEVVARRVAELVREDLDDLGRPQELVLEVDELLGRAER